MINCLLQKQIEIRTALLTLGFALAVDFLACQEFLCSHEKKVCRFVQKTALELRRGCSVQLLYRVIHKSVKYLKNSQQIDYATDHGNSYVDRERNCLSFFKGKARAHCCPDLPLGDSSSKYGVQ